MEQTNKIINPNNDELHALDFIKFEDMTWKQKMMSRYYRSEIIDNNFFKSDNGETFQLGDKRVRCLIKEDDKTFRHTYIKGSQIGSLYKIIEVHKVADGIIIVELLDKTTPSNQNKPITSDVDVYNVSLS